MSAEYRRLTETLRNKVELRMLSSVRGSPKYDSWARALALLEEELEEQRRYQEAQEAYALMIEQEEVPH